MKKDLFIIKIEIKSPLSLIIWLIAVLMYTITETWLKECDSVTVPFLRNFHWGGKTGKKGRTKNMSRRGLANARV